MPNAITDPQAPGRTTPPRPPRAIAAFLCVWTILLLAPIASAADSTASAADSTAVAAESPAASAGEPAADYLLVLLTSGEEVRAVRVLRSSRDNLLAVLRTGDERSIPIHRVRAVIDELGDDRTNDVLNLDVKLDLGVEFPPGPKGPPKQFRGAPWPERTRYLVMETGYLHPLSSRKSGADLSGYGVWQLAYLTNLNKDVAVGPAIQVELGEDEARFEGLVRGRRWFSRTLSLEAAAGIGIGTNDDGADAVRTTKPSFVTQGSVNIRDAVQLTFQAETYRREVPVSFVPFPGFPTSSRTESGVQFLMGLRAGAQIWSGAPGYLAFLGAMGLTYLAARAGS